LIHAGLYGLVLTALCQLGEWFLLLVGQQPELARGGGGVLVTFGWSLPAMLMYSATVFLLEGIGRPMPGMVVMILANLLNILLN
jgi:MATE family multidrug resistance protein